MFSYLISSILDRRDRKLYAFRNELFIQQNPAENTTESNSGEQPTYKKCLRDLKPQF